MANWHGPLSIVLMSMAVFVGQPVEHWDEEAAEKPARLRSLQ